MYIAAFLFLVLLRSWKLKRRELDSLTSISMSARHTRIEEAPVVQVPGKFRESARYLISWGKV